ncbi:1-aminocyclopropane-1-carboxylate oxidase 1-like [Magnolia sinica]|uniref:1-aminocyclopropane-1-carboxylate oxidase 1-like n=1 Tax=Magnolia sinica TaxID=86752 RepID=UPI002659BC58|nr:1-aminocyclopropane-1-carboxylate oxidase 1-like [Magnolia sinica]
MGMPVIDLSGLDGENRKETMALLRDAFENWGFFQIVNHGMPLEVMDKVKKLANAHLAALAQKKFQESELVKKLEGVKSESEVSDVDWEACFFVQNLPISTIADAPDLSAQLKEAVEEYVAEAIKLTEKMLDLVGENLGLEKGYLKKAFSGANGPFMGTKFAQYPSCPKADLIKGLRTHSDAGGLILVLQDDRIPGLQFLKDGEWVDVTPLPNSIFVNTGEQLEVISNGRIKSIPHRVIAREEGGRLSIASFYNPASDAVISPAEKLVYPQNYRFEDYMKIYSGTKFAEKEPRFETMKKGGVVAPSNGQACY